MKRRVYGSRADKTLVMHIIRTPIVDTARIWRAFNSLPERDRGAMPYVPHLLAFEG